MTSQPTFALRSFTVQVGETALPGELAMPEQPAGTVVFAHGSGSSRHSPRNRAVATALREAGFATLLFDLLTEAEAGDRRAVFDIGLLAARLVAGIDQVSNAPEVAGLPVGAFGASTGAAAALDAAGARAEQVRAVVSRGGRPDLASRPAEVLAPTLLIVGGADTAVLRANREAARHLGGPVEVEVIDGAGHLFERPGELEQVGRSAIRWFRRYLASGAPS